MTTMKYAPQDVKATELGRADRVFEEGGRTFKLAQHLETGQWAIWMMYTETHDEKLWWAETKHLPFDEAGELRKNYKLEEPARMAMKVDDDISPDYARSNEGIFETRCLSVLGY